MLLTPLFPGVQEQAVTSTLTELYLTSSLMNSRMTINPFESPNIPSNVPSRHLGKAGALSIAVLGCFAAAVIGIPASMIAETLLPSAVLAAVLPAGFLFLIARFSVDRVKRVVFCGSIGWLIGFVFSPSISSGAMRPHRIELHGFMLMHISATLIIAIGILCMNLQRVTRPH